MTNNLDILDVGYGAVYPEDYEVQEEIESLISIIRNTVVLEEDC